MSLLNRWKPDSLVSCSLFLTWLTFILNSTEKWCVSLFCHENNHFKVGTPTASGMVEYTD